MSCGCLQSEWCKANVHRARSVLVKYTSYQKVEYKIWTSVKARCFNPKCSRYEKYGGRGITICRRFRFDFIDFLHDLGPRISDDHSIDRENNDGHYSCGHCADCDEKGWPPNVRWATRKQQQLNRTNTLYLTLGGVRRPLAVWAEMNDLRPALLADRIRRGWPVEKAILTPLIPKGNHSK
jgi:hypothetical protein